MTENLDISEKLSNNLYELLDICIQELKQKNDLLLMLEIVNLFINKLTNNHHRKMISAWGMNPL